MNILVKKSLLLLVKFIPANILDRNQKKSINKIVVKENYDDPKELANCICKVIPIQIIKNKPELVESIINVIQKEQYQNKEQIFNSIKEMYRAYNKEAKPSETIEESYIDSLSEQNFENAEEAISYLAERIVDDPSVLAKYLLSFSIESFKYCCDLINDLKKLDVLDKLSVIEASKDMVAFGQSNPDYMKSMLTDSLKNLFIVYRELQCRFDFYFGKIQELDNQPSWKFYLCTGPLAYFSGNIDTNNQIAKLAIEGMREAVNVQILISHYLNADINSSTLKNFENFTNQILNEENCKLLQAYEKDQNDYWLMLPEKCKQTLENKTLLLECLNNN